MINKNHDIIVYMSSPDNPVFLPKFSVVFATYLTRFAFRWKLDFHVAMQGIWYYLSWLANLEQLCSKWYHYCGGYIRNGMVMRWNDNRILYIRILISKRTRDVYIIIILYRDQCIQIYPSSFSNHYLIMHTLQFNSIQFNSI